MSHLGILLACDHYPNVAPEAEKFDARLRKWFEHLGHCISRVSLFETYDGDMPDSSDQCDFWIVSGAAPEWHPARPNPRGIVFRALRLAASSGNPIYAVYHGEHVVHAALASPFASPPSTCPQLHSIRNPFFSFGRSDTLHVFGAAAGEVRQLDRPEELKPNSLFSGWLRVA